MNNAANTERFWQYLSRLVKEHKIVIDRPKGSAHPRYPDLIYPVDYGYLDETTTVDNGGIDVWRGTLEKDTINGIICTVDLLKSDAEMKIILNCTTEEIQIILKKHNEFSMAGVWVENPCNICD